MLNYVFTEIHGFLNRKYSAPQVNTLLILHMFNGHIFSRGQHIRSTSEHYISNEKHNTAPAMVPSDAYQWDSRTVHKGLNSSVALLEQARLPWKAA